MAILIGALFVFLACLMAITCLCYRQRKRRRKPMPLPPGLNLGLAPTTANGVPILPFPAGSNGAFMGPYTHMSEQSDSSDSTHLTTPDHSGDNLHYRGGGHLLPKRRKEHDNNNWRRPKRDDCIHVCPHDPHKKRYGHRGSGSEDEFHFRRHHQER